MILSKNSKSKAKFVITLLDLSLTGFRVLVFKKKKKATIQFKEIAKMYGYFTIYTLDLYLVPSFKELNFQLQNWLQADLKNK